MTKSITKSIDENNKLFITSKRVPTDENIRKYKGYINKLTTVIRNAERNY